MTRVELSSHLKQAVEAGTPVEVIDPSTREVYYLLSADQFQRISFALSDFDPRDMYPSIDALMAEDDARDPLLDSYQ